MPETPKAVLQNPPGSLSKIPPKAPGIEPSPSSEDVEIHPPIRSRYPLKKLLEDLEQAPETSPEITEALANMRMYGPSVFITFPFTLEYNFVLRITSELFEDNPDITSAELFRALRARVDESDREWVASMQDRTPHQEVLDDHDLARLGHQAFLTTLARTLANHDDQTLTHKGGNHA